MKKLLVFLVIAIGVGAMLRVVVIPGVGGIDFAAVLPAVVALLTNDARSAENLAKLTTNAKLTQAAQAKANDMATKGYFAHNTPDGKTPWYWIDQTGYKYEYAGENLAVNFNESEEVVKAWLQSPLHKFNILRRQYTEIGIGTANGMYQGRPATFVVQMFGTPTLAK